VHRGALCSMGAFWSRLGGQVVKLGKLRIFDDWLCFAGLTFAM